MVLFNCRQVYVVIIKVFTIICHVWGEYNIQFDKNFVGAVFSPYVKNLEGNSYPALNDYTMDEVETMLLLISTKFRTIATLEMGTDRISIINRGNEPWKNGNAVGFTGIAAAKLNKKKSSTLINVILGVWRIDDSLLGLEINRAFSVAKEANRIHPGTVWGVTLTDTYVTNNETAHEVLKMIAKGKEIMGNESNSLKYGTALHSDMWSLSLEESTVPDFLKTLIETTDYINCYVMIDNIDTKIKGVQYAAKYGMSALETFRRIVNIINPNVIVIGVTGWPSSGVSPNRQPSIDNLVNYWQEISKISSETQLPVLMISAIDIPWGNKLEKHKDAPDGPCGSLGHYGWWRRKSNHISSLIAYVEKIKEPDVITCEEMEMKRLEGNRKAMVDFQFDNNFVGVTFSPYVKHMEGNAYPAFDNYTVEEVEQMLLLVSSKFRIISTMEMGATTEEQSWKDGDAVGFVGIAAARLNEKRATTLISVIIGVARIEKGFLQDSEVNLAFSVAKEANSLHKGTVWGVTFTDGYVTNNETLHEVLGMIKKGKDIMGNESSSLKYGVRLGHEACASVVNETAEPDYLLELMKHVDYIYCDVYPKKETAARGVKYAAEFVMNLLSNIRREMKLVNPKLIVLGETEWPSSGMNPEAPPSTINLVNYWQTISKIASETESPIFIFEAIDEPWRNTIGEDEGLSDGICGSQANLGWWRLKGNKISALDSYVEKINDPQLLSCEELKKKHLEELEKKRLDEAGMKQIERSRNTWITVSLLMFAAVAIILISLYQKCKSYKLAKLAEEEIEKFENGDKTKHGNIPNADMALQLPYDRKFELDKNDFIIDENCVLGSGQFGIVYKGVIKNMETEMKVAFKTTKPPYLVKNLKGFLAEIKLMIYIGEHPNIVTFVGAYTGNIRKGEIYIASEFCSRGSLEKFLRSSCTLYDPTATIPNEYNETISHPHEVLQIQPDVAISNPNLIKWSFHIACGMQFLTSKNVVHADLASRNVLLTENGTAKITDFGLSRKLYEYTVYVKKKKEPLPWRWMSIESLRKFHFSSQSDVWSFGVTLWEIFSKGDTPYPGLTWDDDFVTKLEEGFRLNKPKYASEDIFRLMEDCWKVDPDQRPTFGTLTVYFENLLGKKLNK